MRSLRHLLELPCPAEPVDLVVDGFYVRGKQKFSPGSDSSVSSETSRLTVRRLKDPMSPALPFCHCVLAILGSSCGVKLCPQSACSANGSELSLGLRLSVIASLIPRRTGPAV